MSTTTESPALHIQPDAAALAHAAAELLLERANAAIADHGHVSIALTGGSTPRVLYARLADPELRGRTDWARWRVFFGDERAVGPEHADSNYRMAREALLAHVPIPATQVHRLAGEAALYPGTLEDYTAALARDVAPNPALRGGFPGFDLLLLGMGADGHVASLFPGSPALEETTAWVVVNPIAQMGTRRLTLTLPVLNAAREVWLIVTGANKAERVQQAFAAGEDDQTLPVMRVRPRAGKLVWWLDAEAARLLPKRHTHPQS